MLDDTLRLQADTAQFVQQLERATEALTRLYAAQDKIVSQTQKINTATNKIQNTFSLMNKDGEKVAVTFAGVGKQVELVGITANNAHKNLVNIEGDINKLGAAAARNAIKQGNFNKALAAAETIQAKGIKKQILKEIDVAQVQQPLDIKNFTRNLRRGFEEEIRQLPTIAQASFKQIERNAAATAAQMGLTWEQFNKKFQAIRAGKIQVSAEGDEAKLQKALIALGGQYDKLDTIRTRNATNEAQINKNREAALRGMYLEQQRQAAQEQQIYKNRQVALRGMYLEQQRQIVQDQQINRNREAALRGMQIAQQKEAEIQRNKVTYAQQYAAFEQKLSTGQLKLSRDPKVDTDLNKVIKTFETIDSSGQKATARLVTVDGAVKKFTTSAVESSVAQAKAAAQQSETMQRQTKAAAAAGQFYGQIGKTLTPLTGVTKQYNLATGEVVETHNSLNKQGQQLITTITKQGNAVKGMTQVVYEQEKANRDLYLSWQSIVRLFTIQVLHQVVSSIVAGLQQSIQIAQQLQISIAQVQTISESGFDVSKWTKGIMEVSNATGLLADDVAKGTYNTLSNQIADGAEALEFLTKAGNLAVATNSTLDESVNALSSAINSYGLSAKDTTHISDVFFKMIDLGRITMKDFANDIGRLYPGAQQLGVRLEEVSAVLSTLTRAGVPYNQAATSLFNIFSRLIKPAGEMKEFLRGIGVESGQAAIQTYGFAQVLAKVAQFAQGRPEILGQLFPDIRGLRGVLRLSGEGLKEFQNDLKAMDNAAGTTADALEKFATNTGKIFQIEMNKIKNYYTETFGIKFIELAVKAGGVFGGLSEAMKLFTNQVLYLGSAAVLGALGRFVIGTIAIETSVIGMQTAFAKFATFLKTNWIGIIAAAVAVVGGYIQKLADDDAAAFGKEQERVANILKAAQDAGRALTEKALKPIDEAINKQTTSLNLLLAKINVAYDELAKDLVADNEKIMESFKEVHESFVNYLGDGLKKIKDDLKESENIVKAIDKLAVTLTFDIDEQKRRVQLDEAETAIEKQKLLREEYERTFAAMQQEQNRDKRLEYLDKARKIAEELRRLDRDQAKEAIRNTEKRKDLQDEFAKLKREEADIAKQQQIADLEYQKKLKAEAKKKGVSVTTVDGELKAVGLNQEVLVEKDRYADEQRIQRLADNKKRQAEIVEELKKTNNQYQKGLDLNTELDKLKEEALRIDREQRALEIKKQEELKKQEDEYEKMIKQSKEAFTAIEKVKFDKLVDPKTSKKNFDDIIKDGNKAVETLSSITQSFAGKDYNKRVEYEQKLAAIKENLAETERLSRLRIAAQELATKLDTLNVEQRERKKKLEEEMNKRRDLVAGIQTSISTELPALDRLKVFFERSFRTGGLSDRAGTERNVIAQVIEVINKIRGGEATRENFDKLRSLQMQTLQLQDKASLNTRDALTELNEILETVMKREAVLKEQDTKIAELTTSIKKEAESIDNLTKEMSKRFGVDLAKLFENSQNINKIVNNTENTVTAIINGFENLIRALPASIQVQTLTTELPTPQPKAFGGMMHGKDSIPALLSKGEFVVNAAATRRFYSQLVAMNNVRGYASGGLVTNNVGDIHLSMNSSGNVQTDIVAIGKGLRREIRRGRIRLS